MQLKYLTLNLFECILQWVARQRRGVHSASTEVTLMKTILNIIIILMTIGALFARTCRRTQAETGGGSKREIAILLLQHFADITQIFCE